MSEETTTPTPSVSIDAKILDDIKSLAHKQAELSFNAKLRDVMGVDSLDKLAELKKLDEEKKMLEKGEFEKLSSQIKEDSQAWKNKYTNAVVEQSIIRASSELNALDSDIVLALVRDKAVVDEKGSVTIDNKSASDYIKELLGAKPYLVKPTGNSGSGSSAGTALDDKAKYEVEYEAARKAGNIIKLLELKRKSI